MNGRRAMLAAAAAALFTAGMSTGLASGAWAADNEMVKCQGVNACKGQSDCKSAQNECSGKNSCKGKGWKKMSKEECDKAKQEKGS